MRNGPIALRQQCDPIATGKADGYRRLIYVSRAIGDADATSAPILAESRCNNGLDGLTDIFWNNRVRLLQLLEGPPDSVADTFGRIRRDVRHEALEVVSDTVEPERVFADWLMAGGPGERPRDELSRLRAALVPAPAAVRAMIMDEGDGSASGPDDRSC